MNQDEQKLIDFWSNALELSEEDRAEILAESPENWRETAPSEKLLRAAESLGRREKVLDYGCGNGWAGIIAAKCGCPDVTAVDAAPGAVRTTRFLARHYGAEQVHADCVPKDWLKTVPDNLYDGLICSNVLDMIPPESAEEILRESARIVRQDADVIIGLNFWMSPEKAAERGIQLTDGNRLYVDGVLRLVSRSDEEWEKIFAPWYTVERLEHFAWPGETAETRRLFYLRPAGRRADTES